MSNCISSRSVGGVAAHFHNALRQMPSWLVSMVFHMVLMLAMALWMLDPQVRDGLRQIVATAAPEELKPSETETILDERTPDDGDDMPPSQPLANPEIEPTPPLLPSPPFSPESSFVSTDVVAEDFGPVRMSDNALLKPIGGNPGDYHNPGKGIKKDKGETDDARKAVLAALKWLADHQLPDGGWSFDLSRAPACGGKCRDAGGMGDARVAATALALLPFLGHGDTHQEGQYKPTVARGLYFLTTHAKVGPNGCALNESGGRMYSHGLASIVLTEAYGMTKDRKLYVPAQGAVNFICYAQGPAGGGWRYEPQQAGDTSVLGWQIMALKSGHLAYLRVPPQTIRKAAEFLDAVQTDSGAAYGYLGPGTGDATTAIGLLCRMHLGWRKDHPALQRGVQFLSQRGPSEGNMYYNYYATQVLFHWRGDQWKKWNDVMRDQLVRTQARKGHEAGSWFMGKGSDLGAASGGRLYCTAMAAMTLEVYYRVLPIYQRSVEVDFPE